MTTKTQIVGHYELLEQIGSGGSGVLWKANDTHLNRTVAIKFLSSEFANREDMRERFAAEARAASAIDHPNICTVYDIGTTDSGEIYIAIAYYGNATLKQRIASGPLEPRHAIGIAVQIARGLAAAHEEMIVHRDIKPGNIMLAEHDTVKIVDFGLAKCMENIKTTDPELTLGTPAYMSPEQIRGQDVGIRTDIWSLGVVLFEMVTGTLPFEGETAGLVIDSILNKDPRSLAEVAPDIPSRLEKVISRAIQKSPRARYDSAEEIIADLRDLQADVDSDAPTIRRRAVGKRTSSIAVLPFSDMSADHDQEFLCDGLAEEILNALSQIKGLRVASRTSSFQFKGRAGDIRDIGKKLNVNTVLEGSVRRSGERVRVTAQLVNVDDGYRLWSERYDRDLSDIFAIEDEIAQCIADALQVTLGENRSSPAVAPENTEAWELYLHGKRFFRQHRRQGLEIARQNFERALELDPNYALAWAGLANCWAFGHFYFGIGGDDAAEEAEKASRRALELAPNLAEARVARGLARSLVNDGEGAFEHLERAIEIDPVNYEAHYMLGRFEFAEGKMQEASIQFERACSISPDAFDSWYLLGMAARRLGEAGRARKADLECIEAVKHTIRSHPENTRALTMGAAVFAELGEPERAVTWVERARNIDPGEPMIEYNAACVYISLSDHDKALDCLEAATKIGTHVAAWAKNDPDLDPIREHPRFVAVLEEFGKA